MSIEYIYVFKVLKRKYLAHTSAQLMVGILFNVEVIIITKFSMADTVGNPNSKFFFTLC